MTPAYENCITRTVDKRGSLEIACKKGLWAVAGMDREKVESEARRYWIQYFTDGEYTDKK